MEVVSNASQDRLATGNADRAEPFPPPCFGGEGYSGQALPENCARPRALSSGSPVASRRRGGGQLRPQLPSVTHPVLCFLYPAHPGPLSSLPVSTEICAADCGGHGVCVGGTCRCEDGWMGAACDQRACHPRCAEHGTCRDGKCECSPGWNGEHCTIGMAARPGAPSSDCPGT